MMLLRYMASGGAGLLVYYLALYAFVELEVWYIHASLFAKALSFGVGFALHKLYTFRNKTLEAVPLQLTLYVPLEMMVFGANTWGLHHLVKHWQMHYLLAQIILSIILSIVAFPFKWGIFTRKKIAKN